MNALLVRWAAVTLSLLLIGGCAGVREYTHKIDRTTFKVGISVCSGADQEAAEAALARLRVAACGDSANTKRVTMTTVSPAGDSSTMCPGGWMNYENVVYCESSGTR